MPLLSHLTEIRAGVTLRGRDATRPISDGAVHLIRIGDLRGDGQITGSSVVRISPRDSINPEQFLRRGDVLVAARGSRNTAAVYELDLQNAIAGSQFFILRPREAIDGRYLAWFLRSETMQRHFDSFLKASDETAMSRYYGGIHYLNSSLLGAVQGRQIGNYIWDKLKLTH